MTVQIIHTQDLAEGILTVYSNGDYILLEGEEEDVEALSTYYQSGSGPYRLELLVQRLVALFELRNGLEQSRASAGVLEQSRQRSGTEAVRHLSREDRLGVPAHMRSDTSRFRADLRLQNPATSDAERLRRERQRASMTLGTRLGNLHAYLQNLITEQGDKPRFYSDFMADDSPGAGLVRQRPTELQLAIEGGLVVEAPGGRQVITDLRRGLNNDIVDLLAQELPGFQTQYENSFERARQRIIDGMLMEAVLTVIDILDLLVTLGGSALVSGMRRIYGGAARAMREAVEGVSEGLARRAETSAAGQADEALTGEVVSEIPAGAIDATPARTVRSGGGGDLARQSATQGEGRIAAREASGDTGTRAARSAQPDVPAAQPRQLLPDNPVHDPSGIVEYHGPLVSWPPRETLIREIFNPERLRNLLDGFRLLDEILPDAIRRVSRRRNIHSGRGAPAASDLRLAELERELREIIPDRRLLETDALTAAQRTRAIEILEEARVVARNRWNTLRQRLWQELYNDPEVRRLLRMMEQDGLIRLPRGFPNTGSAPRAIGAHRDGIIWMRTQENVPIPEIARELGLTTQTVERLLANIRRRIRAGRPPPDILVELPLNMDHITPVQLNPFNFFDPNNLRVLTASYNDTFLRLYQMRSAFPMTDDLLEEWIRAFSLY